jgi:hypothetical protein
MRKNNMHEMNPGQPNLPATSPNFAHSRPVAGQQFTQPPVAQPGVPASGGLEQLFTDANDRMHRFSHSEWYGSSGACVSGADVAKNLDAALDLLKKKGWDKHNRGDDFDLPDWNPSWGLLEPVRIIWQMVRDAANGPITVEDAIRSTGSSDVRRVTDRCLCAILGAAQNSICSSVDSWAERPEVSASEVEGLFATTAEFARRYSPGGGFSFALPANQQRGLTAY